MRGAKWAFGLAVILGGVVGLTRADDEVYDLRGPAPKKGQVFTTKMVLKIKNADVVLKAAGQTLKLKQTMTVTTEEEEKLLVVDGRQATKSQARVLKDQVETV